MMYSRPGLYLYLTQNWNIPLDGSGRILITDIGYSDSSALLCWSTYGNTGESNWYIHPTKESTAESDIINSSTTPYRGWYSNRYSHAGHAVRLWRDPDTITEEGVFTCHNEQDSNSPVSVGIYYRSELMASNILHSSIIAHYDNVS